MDFLERDIRLFFKKPLKHVLGVFMYYHLQESAMVKKNYSKSIRELLTDGYNFLSRMIQLYPVSYNAQRFKERFEKKLRYMDKRIETFLDFPIGTVYNFEEEVEEEITLERNVFDLGKIVTKNVYKLFKVDLDNVIFKPESKMTYKEYLEKILNEKKFEPLKEDMTLKGQNITGSYILYDMLIGIGLKDTKYKNDKMYKIFLYFYMLNSLLIYKYSIYESLFELYANSIVYEKKLYKDLKERFGVEFKTKMMQVYFNAVMSGFDSRFLKYNLFIEKLTKEIRGE